LTLVYFVALAGQPRALVQGVYGAGKALQFALPLLFLWLGATGGARGAAPAPDAAARRRWPGWAGALPGAAFGVALYAATLALYLGALRPAGVLAGAPAAAIRAKVTALGVGAPAAYAALAVFYSVVHSAAEEYYWRWFVFGELRRACRLPAAVAASSAGFAAHHVVVLAVFFGWGSPWPYALAAVVGAGGAFWAWLYHRSGSLLGPWLGHLLADAAIFTVGFDLLR
jgi:membrane protease YdiL (CAAX protease family)